MKLLFFFMGISNLLLIFQKKIVISFGLEKVPQKYPQQLRHFLGVEDDFSYENKFH
jgi:hypothetical protein